jgi:hypothetical protein
MSTCTMYYLSLLIVGSLNTNVLHLWMFHNRDLRIHSFISTCTIIIFANLVLINNTRRRDPFRLERANFERNQR